MKQMVPVAVGKVRRELNLNRSQLAREAGMQPGVIGWIETGRYYPYDTQLEKIASVFRKHGWTGETETLLEEVG